MIDLPHISNFTDVEPFLASPTSISGSSKAPGAGHARRVLLPGSKNVIMTWPGCAIPGWGSG